jgi:hypothetical protein
MDAQAMISALRNKAQKFISLDQPKEQDLGDVAADIGAGFVPGVGTALSMRDFERARRDDDWLGMGLAGVGMVPVLGGVTRGVGKAAATIDALRQAPKAANIVRPGNPIQGAVVLIGDKIFMGRTHGDALNRAVYEGVVRKDGGKFIYPKDADVDMDLFMTNDGRIIDRIEAFKELDVGAAEDALDKGLMQQTPGRSMSVDSYMEQARALRKKRDAAQTAQ